MQKYFWEVTKMEKNFHCSYRVVRDARILRSNRSAHCDKAGCINLLLCASIFTAIRYRGLMLSSINISLIYKWKLQNKKQAAILCKKSCSPTQEQQIFWPNVKISFSSTQNSSSLLGTALGYFAEHSTESFQKAAFKIFKCYHLLTQKHQINNIWSHIQSSQAAIMVKGLLHACPIKHYTNGRRYGCNTAGESITPIQIQLREKRQAENTIMQGECSVPVRREFPMGWQMFTLNLVRDSGWQCGGQRSLFQDSDTAKSC